MIYFVWKEPKSKYSSGEDLYIKNIYVGGWFWDACRPKNSNISPYKISSIFPIKINEHFENENDAKNFLETKIKSFLDYLYNEG